MTTPEFNEWEIRNAAFAAVRERIKAHGPILPSRVLADPFMVRGTSFLLSGKAGGIFRPRGMPGGALSIRKVIPGRGRIAKYEDDRLTDSEDIVYDFQKGGADHHSNQLLLAVFESKMPLIYFYGVAESLYWPIFPAYIREWDPVRLKCTVWTGPSDRIIEPGTFAADRKGIEIERRYATYETKRRLHQAEFRLHVLEAYDDRCAVCRFPRRELLDAAHIVADSNPLGVAEVPNGLALCKLHHGAYDANLLGIRPDGFIDIAESLLKEHDGPTLEIALKGFKGKSIHPPRVEEQRPKREYLEQRYELFLKAG